MVSRLANQFDWEIENQKAFEESIEKMSKYMADFRIPLRLIASDFYRSQKQLFTLQSAGLYQDLSEKPFLAFWQNKNGFASYYSGGYKEYKKVNLGFVYPILVGKTRDLANSTLGRNHRYSIFNLDKTSLAIGTSVPYGKYHQSDAPRRKIPQRKFIFITGGEGDKSKDSGLYGRRERWTLIIDTHVKQVIEGKI